jgi:adenine-specific DNA-methyltransferase
MSQKLEKLKKLLLELFQLDQPDLDFGFYRIMHAKAVEVTQFLEKDLLPQVTAAFAEYLPADKAVLEKELEAIVTGIEKAGMDPAQSPKVQELRARIADEAVDIGALESEVYDALYSFFRRYYSEGDFLAKRVYKAGVYAIPYEGEEVKLHWANADQYYIKTSEYLRDYAFRLRPEDESAPMRVHFRLVDATEGEHGNVKAVEGKDRVFVLAALGTSGRDLISEEEGELQIGFEYRPATLTDWPDHERAGKTKPPTQKELTASAVKRLLAVDTAELAPWIAELGKPHIKNDGEKADYTRLAAHLRRYTARNTFDYFIHKNLGEFLRRELDFYIKNEVMHLDDVGRETAPRVEQYLSKLRIIRRIASKLIEFLAQLEDFQRTLWLKKKLVVETTYLIGLGAIHPDFYPEIVENSAQKAEWLHLRVAQLEPGQSTTIEFLKANPSLVLDTRFFSDVFTARLIDSLSDLDDQVHGLLVHSENFQALRLLENRYRERLNCIYIDPPYNSDASAIDYKNGYKASSWAALLDNRLHLSRSLLTPEGVLVAAIDDEQHRELAYILAENFDGHLLGTIVVRANPSGRPTQSGYSVSHEYLLFAGRTYKASIGRMPPTERQMARFSQRDALGPFEWRNLRREGSNSDRSARRHLYYPIYIRGGSIRVPNMKWDDHVEEWIILEEPLADEIVAWPDNEEGDQKTWRWEGAKVMATLPELAVRKDRSGRDYVYVKRRPHEEGVVVVSSWFDAKYSATEHGTAVLKALFGRSPFSYPKSLHAVSDAVYVAGAARSGTTTLDFFAGSGTTGHAVINLNRADGGGRRFILVEMGDYFETVLVPRLKKVVFSSEWKDGKPLHPANANDLDRSPKIMKLIRLESYEDVLNNLDLRRTDDQGRLLLAPEAGGDNGLKEQYLLRYLLDVEARGSQSLLNVAAFADPTAYRLKVKRPGSDESRDVNVDLLETFNWLVGLTVQHIAFPKTFRAEFERDSEGRLRLKGRVKQEADGPWWFRTVTGTTPDGRKTLVIWRKRPGGDTPEGVEEDNLVLDGWFAKQGYSSKDSEFDLIYVNGDNNLENLKTPTDAWKVRLIEEDFHRLMFDVDGP